jgi:Eco29kI restriction endonuclease
MIAKHPFNREEHIFRSPELENLLKDAIRFFNGTPVYNLPPPKNFIGSGIYAIYYTGSFELYSPLAAVNRIRYELPIYVGKAIPSGSRRGQSGKEGSSLYKRLGEHAKSIQAVENLDLADFHCRFVIIPHEEDALIPPIESAIIKQYNPLWNTCVDGFGNHDPGGGRYDQARSQWDVIHPGRRWAEKLKGVKGENDPNVILKNIQDYVETLQARGSDV